MTMSARQFRNRPREGGFALLLVVFLTTVMLIGIMAAAPSIRTERQREKEEEMIWRGKQYIRGIKLYYRKTGRFPTSVDDLTKPKLGSLRFMRQKYKDPVNTKDGEWRLIYVGPAGQLVGSLKPQQTFQIPGLNAAPAARPPAPQQSGFGSSSFGSSGFGQQPSQQPGAPGAAPQPGGQGAPGTGQSTSPGPTEDSSTAAASGISTTNPLMGGNIIGVGSQVNKRSIIIYDKAKNYRLFEFVWNPSKDLMNAIAQPARVGGANAPGQGQSGFGQSGFGQPANGTPTSAPQPDPPARQQPPQP